MSQSDSLLSLIFLDLFLRSSLILIVLVCALTLLRRRSAALRHFVGLLGLASLLLLPWGMWALPQGWALLPSLSGWLERSGGLVGGSLPSLRIGWVWGGIFCLWFVGAVLILRRFLLARKALRGFFSRAREEPAFSMPLARAIRALGEGSRSSLRVSTEVDVPVTFGILASHVLLPSNAREWSDERLYLVLLHELAHVRRRDLLAQAIGLLVCALYWFHPLVWFLGRRLDLERERACDDLVLSFRGDAVVYARQLVEFASSLRGRPVSAFGVLMARPSQLGRRLSALLDRQIDRRVMQPGQAWSAVILGVLALLPLAASGPGLAKAGVAPVAEEGTSPEESWEGRRPMEPAEPATGERRDASMAHASSAGHGHRSGPSAGHSGHPSGPHSTAGPGHSPDGSWRPGHASASRSHREGHLNNLNPGLG